MTFDHGSYEAVDAGRFRCDLAAPQQEITRQENTMARATVTNPETTFPSFPFIRGFEPGAFFPKAQGPFDPEVLAAIQRRNLDAWTAASRLIAEGVQVILKRQAELVQQALEQSTGFFQPAERGDVQEKAVQQIDLIKKLYEHGVAGTREISGIAVKSGREAVDLLARRTEESLDELKSTVRKAA
jgi:phasin family protein